MEVDPLERLQTLEGPRLHVWNVALGQVELGQELETVKRLRADRLDRVAAKREAHEGRGLAVEGFGWNLEKVWLLANLILNRRPVLAALILIDQQCDQMMEEMVAHFPFWIRSKENIKSIGNFNVSKATKPKQSNMRSVRPTVILPLTN